MDESKNVATGSGGNPADGGDTGRRAGREGMSLRNLRTFDSLKNPAYRLYWTNMMGYTAGMNMEILARNLLIWELTESPTILGLKSLALALPMLVFSLLGGVIADRILKNHVILAGQLVSAAISLSIALSLTFGYLGFDDSGSWWILIVAAAGQGTVMSLMMPSRQAMVYEIVGGEQVLNAVSLNTAAMSGMRVLGPALAGFLIDTVDYANTYFIITGLYLVSSLLILFLPRTSPTALGGQGAISNIKAGIDYVRQEKVLLIILLFGLVGIILATPYMTLMPIVASEILGVGATGLGLLMMFIGIGAIAGSLVLASLPDRNRGRLLLISAVCLAVSLIGFAFSTTWYVSLSLLILVGIGQTGLIATAVTVLQDYSRDEYRGRVMSIFMMEVGLMGLGGFAAALITEVVGVQWVIGGAAMALASLSVLAAAFVPRLRNLD